MIFKLCSTSTLLLLGFVATPTPTYADTGAYNCSSSYSYYTPSKDQYLLSILPLNWINLFDGPSSISAAPTPVPASTTPIPEAELKYYVYFAVATYCPYTLPNLSCCYCSQFNSTVTYHKIITNPQYDTLALVTLHPSKNEIVVTFRGSVAAMNFVMDVTLLQTAIGSNIRIHRGFYLSLMSLYNEVVAEVDTLTTANPGNRVVVTGHMLGAAMASLFTFFTKSLNQFPGVNWVLVTYGQTRTGNKGFADYMNALPIPMARVVSRADIGAHFIPVSALGLLGPYYLHHGQEVWINGNQTVFCSKTVYEDLTCSNSMGPGYTLADHFQYFDADLSTCYVVEGWGDVDLFALPVGWTPTSYIPPMPSKMYNFLLPLAQGGYQGLLPLL